MKSVAAAALGYALIGCQGGIPSLSNLQRPLRAKLPEWHPACGRWRPCCLPSCGAVPLDRYARPGFGERAPDAPGGGGGHRSESHGRPREFGWKAGGKTPPWRARGSPAGLRGTTENVGAEVQVATCARRVTGRQAGSDRPPSPPGGIRHDPGRRGSVRNPGSRQSVRHGGLCAGSA